jgi:hypothetical protein
MEIFETTPIEEYEHTHAPYFIKWLLQNDMEFEVNRIPIRGFPNRNRDYDHSFVVRYTDITIRNSRNNSHLIPEIFVRFEVRCETVCSIQGARPKVSEHEIRASYRHSHLQSANTSGFTGFCLGSGDLRNFALEEYFAPSDEAAELFFLLMKDFLSWESVETTPYRFMNTIGKVNTLAANNTLNFPERPILKTYDFPEFSISDGRVIVSREWAEKQLPHDYIFFDGKYYLWGNVNRYTVEGYAQWEQSQTILRGALGIVFKGVERPSEISRSIITNFDDLTEDDKIAHPKLVDLYVKYTEQHIENWLLKKIYSEGAFRNDNAQESVGSNSLPVLKSL